MSQEDKLTGRILQTTISALNAASFRANQYKQVVQKKIDLGAIEKKIELLHTELGKRVADLHQLGRKDILEEKEAARLLGNLLSLRQAAGLLEEEIELIRTEPPAAEKTAQPTEPDNDPSQQ
ncbi:MAG TPA: hypothetical protein VIR78_07645 [Malonomonas sp.]